MISKSKEIATAQKDKKKTDESTRYEFYKIPTSKAAISSATKSYTEKVKSFVTLVSKYH